MLLGMGMGWRRNSRKGKWVREMRGNEPKAIVEVRADRDRCGIWMSTWGMGETLFISKLVGGENTSQARAYGIEEL